MKRMLQVPRRVLLRHRGFSQTPVGLCHPSSSNSASPMRHNAALLKSFGYVPGGATASAVTAPGTKRSALPVQLPFQVAHKDDALTKLVCTIGPASANDETLRGMMEAGMDICRLNFSHGSHEAHSNVYHMVRNAAIESRCPSQVAVALDTKGPEVRTLPNAEGSPSGGIVYEAGSELSLHLLPPLEDEAGAASATFGNTADALYIRVPVDLSSIKDGQTVLVADGSLELTVLKKADLACEKSDAPYATLHCRVECGATLRGRNNAHLLGADVKLPPLSDTDRSDIAFGVKLGIDMVFASFIRSAAHVEEIKAEVQRGFVAADVHPRPLPIVAKIESAEGLRNIDEIIAAADGVMVARGDLAMDTPMEELFLAQKSIIAKCNLAAKPVICATQMLESMIYHPRPTRAEATDVANAVLDGADAIMLSGETANGSFPLKSVEMLRKVAATAQQCVIPGAAVLESSEDAVRGIAARLAAPIGTVAGLNGGDAAADSASIARAAVLASYELRAAFILTTTVSGRSVRHLARMRPRCPIVAVCHSLEVCRSLALVRGVSPLFYGDIGLFADDVKGEVRALTEEEWHIVYERIVERVLVAFRDANTGRGGAKSSASSSCPVIVTNTDRQHFGPFEGSGSMSVRYVPLGGTQ